MATQLMGSNANGVIVSHTTDSDTDGTSYNLKYRFQANNTDIVSKISVNNREYSRLNDGDRVLVRYLAAAPKYSSSLPEVKGVGPTTFLLLIFAVIWNLITFTFCRFILFQPFIEKHLMQNGIGTEAEIVDKHVDNTGESPAYQIKYRFYTPDGKDIVGTITVNEQQFNNTDRGGKVAVFYSTRNPKLNVAAQYCKYELMHAKHAFD